MSNIRRVITRAYQPSAADAVRGSADGRIAVDPHADAGGRVTVCAFRWF